MGGFLKLQKWGKTRITKTMPQKAWTTWKPCIGTGASEESQGLLSFLGDPKMPSRRRVPGQGLLAACFPKFWVPERVLVQGPKLLAVQKENWNLYHLTGHLTDRQIPADVCSDPGTARTFCRGHESPAQGKYESRGAWEKPDAWERNSRNAEILCGLDWMLQWPQDKQRSRPRVKCVRSRQLSPKDFQLYLQETAQPHFCDHRQTWHTRSRLLSASSVYLNL